MTKPKIPLTAGKLFILVILLLVSIPVFAQVNTYYGASATRNPIPTTGTFSDPFDSLDNWILFNGDSPYGNPFPQCIPSIFGRSGIFDNNGGSGYNSGAISKQNFVIRGGFTIESDVYLHFFNLDGCWAGACIGIANPTWQQWGGYEPYIYFELNATGDACWMTPDSLRRHAYLYGGYLSDSGWEYFGPTDPYGNPSSDPFHYLADQYANGWHTLKMVIDTLGMSRFYIDNNLIYSGSRPVADLVMSSARPLFLGTRSSGSAGKAYHDNIIYRGKTLVLKDGSPSHGSIPNDSFVVYKVHNDPPNMTQDSLGVLTTDSLGRMCLPNDWFNVGDSIKVERLVDTVKAVKHKSILPNMYYIKIDNGKFDTTAGAIYYDTLTTEVEQEVIVGHTTVMYDLLVSVEWDADQQYLQNLLEGFRYASNYLYDVTDGQLYLNIVRIYDNKKWWDSADVWIYGSNTEWPRAVAYPGELPLRGGIFGTAREDRVYFPRIFYFNDEDANINLTYSPDLYPYDWAIAVTNYGGENRVYPPSRTMAHEFGHYGIGFLDEYCKCPCDPIRDKVFPGNGTAGYDFGFMDNQLKENCAQCSEMSCSLQYADPTHQVTCQWTGRGNKSCWDYFEWNYQRTYDGIFASVKKPASRMFAGPNDNLQNLNYDVGRLIPSAGAINDYLGGARTVIATLFDQNGEPLPKAKVSLKKFYDTDSSRIIEQGKTADWPYPGQIRCLGYNNWTDEVLGSCAIVIEGKRTEGWLFGKGQIGKSGLSSFQNSYRSSLDGDSLDLFLRAVTGDYPLIYATSLSTGMPEYVLYASRPFSANPTVELCSDGNPFQTYTLQSTPTGYSVFIPDEMGISGMFTLLALDDSAYTFFVNTPYCLTQIVDTAFADIIVGPQGGCELYLDNLNLSLEKILILSSPYPPIRTGLDPLSEQAGEIYSLSSYPAGTLLGSNSLIIRYADSDIHTQSEATLGLFRWNESLQKWESLCGFLDTEHNIVGANINSLGIYAAFTTGYLRGDANGDGVINVSDVVYLINYLFISGPAPDPIQAGDANCDGFVNVTDVVYLINYLFISGPPPCN